MIIGITGLMGSGKSTLCKEILKNNPDITYIDVDSLRSQLVEDPIFLINISGLLDKKITNHTELNNEIYSNENSMQIYKVILYNKLRKELFNQSINSKIIIVEWALIIKDKLLDLFDKLVIIDLDANYILENRKFKDLSLKEVSNRLEIQKDQFYNLDDIHIPYLIHNNLEDTVEFIRKGV